MDYNISISIGFTSLRVLSLQIPLMIELPTLHHPGLPVITALNGTMSPPGPNTKISPLTAPPGPSSVQIGPPTMIATTPLSKETTPHLAQQGVLVMTISVKVTIGWLIFSPEKDRWITWACPLLACQRQRWSLLIRSWIHLAEAVDQVT